jgi:CelD/BcsL family acetyltransferase involved in cellulose biosynthesis
VTALPTAVRDIAPAELAGWEAAWRAVEARAPDAAPFLCFDWLRAWIEAYEPTALRVVCVGDPSAPDAVGLLERAGSGRWELAGRSVSSVRGLLCAEGAEAAAWGSFGSWLREHPRSWSVLGAAGLQRVPPGTPRVARRAAVPVPVLELPESYDAYLAGRSHGTRSRFRRVLRRAERAGAQIGWAGDRTAALEAFVALHTRRAAAQGERHAAVDARLARLLTHVAEAAAEQVRVLEMLHEGVRIGVSVRLDRGATTWFYNGGIDPEALALAPGIALQLVSIRDAIECGARRHDLGPGPQRYKLELGGAPEERVDLLFASPSLRGRTAGAVVGLVHRSPSVERVVRGARRRLVRA